MGTHLLASLGIKGKNGNSLACLRNAGSHSAVTYCTLSWADIKRENFTWRELRALELSAEDLKKMQPDKNEWLQRGGVDLEDLKDMVVFPVNPLTDFAVDLADSELWKMQCSVDEMLRMGIHYDHLVAKGITPAIMAAFRLPLSSWVDLGFSHVHAVCFQSTETQMVFGLESSELVQILREYEKKETTDIASVNHIQ